MALRSFLTPARALGVLAPLVMLSASALPGHAQKGSPFAGLSGNWSGTGTISLASGASERIRCRSTYAVAPSGNGLKLTLRCASDSYRFELSSSVVDQGGTIAGTWSETTRQVSGNVSGQASPGLIQARVEAQGFAANLTLNTRGDKQSVTIASQGTDFTGVQLTLSRGG